MSFGRFVSEHKTALLIGGAVAVAAAAGFALLAGASDEAGPDVESRETGDSQPIVPKGRRGSSSNAPESATGAGSASSADAGSSAVSKPKPGKKGKKGGDSVILSKEQMLAMLGEMADRLEQFKNEMEPKVQPIIESGDEAAYGEYQEEVTRGLKRIEDEVQGKYGCTQVDAMAAQQAYKNDDEVQKALLKIRTVFFGDDESGPGGEGGEGGNPLEGMDPEMLARLMEAQAEGIVVPEGMDADKFFDLFNIHLSTVEAGFSAAMEEATAQVGPEHGREQRLQYFQLLVARRMEGWQSEAQSKVGMSEEDFQKCLMKFQRDPRFMKRIQASQETQMKLTQQLMGMGGAGGDDDDGEEDDGDDGVDADAK